MGVTQPVQNYNLTANATIAAVPGKKIVAQFCGVVSPSDSVTIQGTQGGNAVTIMSIGTSTTVFSFTIPGPVEFDVNTPVTFTGAGYVSILYYLKN